MPPRSPQRIVSPSPFLRPSRCLLADLVVRFFDVLSEVKADLHLVRLVDRMSLVVLSDARPEVVHVFAHAREKSVDLRFVGMAGCDLEGERRATDDVSGPRARSSTDFGRNRVRDRAE